MAPVNHCLPEAQICTVVASHPADGRHLSSVVLSVHLSTWSGRQGVCGSYEWLVWSDLVASKHGY